MGYSKEQYEAATNVLAGRRMEAEAAAAALRQRAIKKDPRVGEIEQALTRSGLQVARAVLAGLDGYRTGDIETAVKRLQFENQQLQGELAQRLQAMGESAVNFEPRYHCPACGDTGYVAQRMCHCLEALLREAACRDLSALSNMTVTRFSDVDLTYYADTPEADGVSPRRRMEDVLAYCQAYAADFSADSPNLLLRGPAGTGKTHLSLAIAGEVAASGRAVIYGSVQRLLRQLEKEHFGREVGDSVERMEVCDLLILDDLGTEFATPFYTSSLYDLINTRLLAGRPTIISTNLNLKQLAERYGVQIASRISGCFQPLLFAGQDIRQQKLRRKLREE
ncbi:MAG: ATP-binding protein [Clostridia bacterium]|nr:ATP-binding protein [Clostridia bacterium]